MTHFSPGFITNPATGYTIENAVWFDGSADALSFVTSSGNRRQVTLSYWYKGQVDASNNQCIASINNGGAWPGMDHYIKSGVTNAENEFHHYNGSGYDWQYTSSAKERDPTAWQHIVYAVDTQQGTASNKVRIYKNGVEITAWSPETDPGGSFNDIAGANYTVSFGRYSLANDYFYGYLAECIYIDGTQYAASDFGEFDSNGVWVPIDPSGLTFGTNGAWLDFADSSHLGLDVSSGATAADASTVAALKFNGSDAATTFTDETGKTWTARNSAQIDTAQSKFGGASGLFDGTSDGLTTPSSPDFDFGTGDFTISAWVRLADNSGNNTIFSANTTGGNDGSPYFTLVQSSGDTQYMQLGRISVGALNSDTFTLANDTWAHVEVSVVSGTAYWFFNGTAEGSDSTGSYDFDFNRTGGGTVIGMQSWDTGPYGEFNGWIDDLIVKKGVGDHTSGFTPSTTELSYTANNSFTPVSMTAAQQVTDSPTDDAENDIGNFSLINANTPTSITLSEGNQRCAGTDQKLVGNIAVTRGSGVKLVVEFEIVAVASWSHVGMIGLDGSLAEQLWDDDGTWRLNYNSAGNFQFGGSDSSAPASYTTGDFIRMEADFNANSLEFFKNGVSQGGFAIPADYSQWVWGKWLQGSGGDVRINTGQRAWNNTPTAGFAGWGTQNLADQTAAASVTPLTSPSFTGNANADGPFVWLGYSPDQSGTSTINGNTITWGTHADALAGGMKLRTASTSYNSTGTNTISIAVDVNFEDNARAQ